MKEPQDEELWDPPPEEIERIHREVAAMSRGGNYGSSRNHSQRKQRRNGGRATTPNHNDRNGYNDNRHNDGRRNGYNDSRRNGDGGHGRSRNGREISPTTIASSPSPSRSMSPERRRHLREQQRQRDEARSKRYANSGICCCRFDLRSTDIQTRRRADRVSKVEAVRVATVVNPEIPSAVRAVGIVVPRQGVQEVAPLVELHRRSRKTGALTSFLAQRRYGRNDCALLEVNVTCSQIRHTNGNRTEELWLASSSVLGSSHAASVTSSENGRYRSSTAERYVGVASTASRDWCSWVWCRRRKKLDLSTLVYSPARGKEHLARDGRGQGMSGRSAPAHSVRSPVGAVWSAQGDTT